jgi:PAS domain-containing protein
LSLLVPSSFSVDAQVPVIALSHHQITVVALLVGAWLAVTLWLGWRHLRAAAAARAQVTENASLLALLATGPAAPLLVHRDGTLTGDCRAAAWLGQESLPADLDDLTSRSGALAQDDGALVKKHVQAAARTGASATLMLKPSGASSILRIDVAPAPPGFGRGTALLWLLDVTVEEQRAAAAGAEAERRSQALEALTALIEAAPFPIWYRGPDLKLALVNSAYVAAVEAESNAGVIAGEIELIDEATAAMRSPRRRKCATAARRSAGPCPPPSLASAG